MKRGQLAVVLVIVLLVAAVAGFVVFSEKRAGRASLSLVAESVAAVAAKAAQERTRLCNGCKNQAQDCNTAAWNECSQKSISAINSCQEGCISRSMKTGVGDTTKCIQDCNNKYGVESASFKNCYNTKKQVCDQTLAACLKKYNCP